MPPSADKKSHFGGTGSHFNGSSSLFNTAAAVKPPPTLKRMKVDDSASQRASSAATAEYEKMLAVARRDVSPPAKRLREHEARLMSGLFEVIRIDADGPFYLRRVLGECAGKINPCVRVLETVGSRAVTLMLPHYNIANFERGDISMLGVDAVTGTMHPARRNPFSIVCIKRCTFRDGPRLVSTCNNAGCDRTAAQVAAFASRQEHCTLPPGEQHKYCDCGRVSYEEAHGSAQPLCRCARAVMMAVWGKHRGLLIGTQESDDVVEQSLSEWLAKREVHTRANPFQVTIDDRAYCIAHALGSRTNHQRWGVLREIQQTKRASPWECTVCTRDKKSCPHCKACAGQKPPVR